MANPPLPDILPFPTPNQPGLADGPTPIPGPFTPPIILPTLRYIRSGNWLVNYEPTVASTVKYDGTIRVENIGTGRTASGDLYQRPVFVIPRPTPIPIPRPVYMILLCPLFWESNAWQLYRMPEYF